jgi:hypothetical protein
MRKIFLTALAVASLSVTAQKKKAPAKSAAPKFATKTVLAKTDGFCFEALGKKDACRIYALAGKDSLQIGTAKATPTNAKIKPFLADATKMINLAWTVNYKQGDPKSRTEDITETHNEIWNPVSKTKVFENVQTVNNISEIVWIDPNKTASKTVDKIRREGSEFTLNQDGTVLLSNKNGQSKLRYDLVRQQFVGTK